MTGSVDLANLMALWARWRSTLGADSSGSGEGMDKQDHVANSTCPACQEFLARLTGGAYDNLVAGYGVHAAWRIIHMVEESTCEHRKALEALEKAGDA